MLVVSLTVVVTPGRATVAFADDCGPDGWRKTRDLVGETYSPWYDTAKGVDFSRQIQFRSLGGEEAFQCGTGRRASFNYSTDFRLTSCLKPTACQLTGWLGYTGRESLPDAGHRFPNKAVGWDRFYKIFRTWDYKSGPPVG